MHLQQVSRWCMNPDAAGRIRFGNRLSSGSFIASQSRAYLESRGQVTLRVAPRGPQWLRGSCNVSGRRQPHCQRGPPCPGDWARQRGEGTWTGHPPTSDTHSSTDGGRQRAALRQLGSCNGRVSPACSSLRAPRPQAEPPVREKSAKTKWPVARRFRILT